MFLTPGLVPSSVTIKNMHYSLSCVPHDVNNPFSRQRQCPASRRLPSGVSPDLAAGRLEYWLWEQLSQEMLCALEFWHWSRDHRSHTC